MTKRFLLAIGIWALCAAPAMAQKIQTDREFDGLKGPVRSVSTEAAKYAISVDLVEEPRKNQSSASYDDAGNLLDQKLYGAHGSLLYTTSFSFLGKARVALTRWNENNNETTLTVERGTKGWVDPRYTHKFVYRYDPKGRRIELDLYLSDGSLESRTTYSHLDNRRIETEFIERRVEQKLVYQFDEKGNVTSFTFPGTLITKETYEYVQFDSQGNWTKRLVRQYIDGTNPTSQHSDLRGPNTES